MGKGAEDAAGASFCAGRRELVLRELRAGIPADLLKTPIVVLSNNDGCVVTRSAEAKALGIKNGTPAFKIGDLIRSGKVVAFSSNYELYGDLSARMMKTVSRLVPAIEPYSIDECFIDLTGVEKEIPELLTAIRSRVLRGVGIPTCVSSARTKTLTKLANHLAKTYKGLGGVLDWESLTPERQERAMKLVPVEEIWGIGRRIGSRLEGMGAEPRMTSHGSRIRLFGSSSA